MMPNGSACSTWQLYVILDREAAAGRDLGVLAQAAIRGGADVLQLRDKTASAQALLAEARRVLPIAQAAGIPLLINDRADVAEAAGADGVHLGQDDLPIDAARRLLGPGRLIGRSTHSLEQALAAIAEGADYIGVGPIFPTPTKPGYGSVSLTLIPQVTAQISIPHVCIGGIEAANLAQVRQAGARCVAVVRAVCAAPDPEAAVRQLKSLMKGTASAGSCV
jgi:thiamine-phosphate pyrophosphorylase